jgi:ABC-type transport system involved in multi-copper enzyme maturation permease subunit
MKNFLTGTGVIFSLEMRQRLRGVAWYVLLGVFFGLFFLITVATSIIVFATGDDSGGANVGGPLYSIIIYFVLLLGSLVAPAMSGNAINGDRDAGTLATTQVTLITTGQIVIGKFLAAWTTALGFLIIALPFLVYGAAVGGENVGTVGISLLVLAAELGVIAAIGVGLSGLIARPLFSIVVTYLSVAALTLGTLIAFTLSGLAIETPSVIYTYNNVHETTKTCDGLGSFKTTTPRFDLVWGVLAPNPFVVLTDAVPATYDNHGNPTDAFGTFKVAERDAQLSPFTDATPASACREALREDSPVYSDDEYSGRNLINGTSPSWPVGLGIQLVLAVAALLGGWAKTRTPARRLARGSRVA